MKINKDIAEYIFDTDNLSSVKSKSCNNSIYYYYWGKYSVKRLRCIPRFIGYNSDTDESAYIIILGKMVISLDKQFKQEAKFIKDNLDLFMKSWYDEYPYTVYLNSIVNGDDEYKKYYKHHHEDDIDIISSNYNIDHDILLFNNNIEIKLPNKCKLIKVTVKNGKVKAHTIFHKKDIQKELDFINEYKDIFEIGSRYNRFWSISKMINDRNSNKDITEYLADYGIIDDGIMLPPAIYQYTDDNIKYYSAPNGNRVYFCQKVIKIFRHLKFNYAIFINPHNLKYRFGLVIGKRVWSFNKNYNGIINKSED